MQYFLEVIFESTHHSSNGLILPYKKVIKQELKLEEESYKSFLRTIPFEGTTVLTFEKDGVRLVKSFTQYVKKDSLESNSDLNRRISISYTRSVLDDHTTINSNKEESESIIKYFNNVVRLEIKKALGIMMNEFTEEQIITSRIG